MATCSERLPSGGPINLGTVFELVKGNNGYTLKTLVNFTGGFFTFPGIENAPGSNPAGSLIADENGNLFGTTALGGTGTSGQGTVFELVKGNNGYTLKTLVNFAGGVPAGSLIADANGNLFGTTERAGPFLVGTVFELEKGISGYTLKTLVTFTGANGAQPRGSLIADANGDLFGTTAQGGTGNNGTVFELEKGISGYSFNTLFNFTGVNGADPSGSLIADANGDLFGTTRLGGTGNLGTVFELVNGNNGYTLKTLVNFTGANGSAPFGSLIADANGDLFGTTQTGNNSNGTVFELVKGNDGYTLKTVVNFTGTNGDAPGRWPVGSLIADANGDLFGTTALGGTSGHGTVFEITNSGFQTATGGPSIRAAQIQAEYSGITRSELSVTSATAISNQIAAGTETESHFINSLLTQVANTTIPAVAVEASMYGATPTSEELTLLATQYLPGQIANAMEHGYNPLVYATEVVGLGLSDHNENGTGFANNWGPGTRMPNSTVGDINFAAAASQAIFGSASTNVLETAIANYVANWKNFYTQNGLPNNAHPTADQIDIAARGAAWGDAVGVAFANNLGQLPGQVANFLEDAAQSTAIYGASLVGQPAHQPFQGA
jgi:hypothetical protein